MALLNTEQLLSLAAGTRRTVDVDIPGLGQLRLRELPDAKSHEFHQLQERQAKGESGALRRIEVLLFSAAIIGEDGKPLLNEKQAGELVDSIGILTSQAIIKAIVDLHGWAKPEAAPGNSEGSPVDY